MLKHRKPISLLLCAAILFSLFGCAANPVETTAPSTQAPTTEPPAPSALEIYTEARKVLDAATDISLELEIRTDTTVAGDTFSEQSTQSLTYRNMGTDGLLVFMKESLNYGVHSEDYNPDAQTSVAYQEIWSQGNIYAELHNTYRFSGPISAEDVMHRYTPVVLLNDALYTAIHAETTAEGTRITFEDPTAPESWAIPGEGELVEAAGSVIVSPQGVITEMTYTITYTNGPAEVTLAVRSRPAETPRAVAAPANPDTYTPITCIDALRLSFSAPAMLLQADSVTASSLESMFSQAAGFLRNQSTVVNLHGRRENTQAKVETGVYVMDYSTKESQKYDLEETYVDGMLTTVEDKGEPVTTGDLGWENMRDYAVEPLLSGMLEMDYWQDVTGTDMGSVYLLEYTLTDDFGSDIQGSICQRLWQDPSFLNRLSSKYENTQLTGYLSVDKYTGLPVATGYYYEGVHTIDGQRYPLTLQYDQSIEAPAKGAYQEITEKMPQEAEPESKPTPLFYHVTGENGQEMWLLGTIHVGDERTAYLPREIYDAFMSSDALALECDSEAFDRQMEEDDALSEQVSNLYFYGGGFKLKGLMEEDTYAQAEKLMKATGNYNMNMPYAKPYVWSSAIEEFYMRQGYQLHRDQGVEERLCDWAEELDKEIIEVESSLFQIKMLTGFSNDLQLWMLEDAMGGSARGYWEGVMDLYEKWCAGDEAILREELSDEVDMTDWTEEEIAECEEYKPLLDEYNKAMSYDRNEGMLKKAIEYLESGEVIFYAVGLAHLLNDVNGLVDTLREAGYTVELVTYAG